MQRREVALALCSLAVMPSLIAAKGAARGPLLWLAKRGNARIYLLGVAEAKDRSWLTPTIQTAFEQSSTLWEEIAPPPSLEHVNQLYEQHGFDSQRTFFDALDPSVRGRAERYMTELSIDRKFIEHMRPWRAYYAFASAFGARPHAAAATEPDYPDRVLLGLAKKSGKSLRYEYPSFDAFVQFLAAMSAEAQSQYIAWLLDYFDAELQGRADADYAWMTGGGDTRSLDRMRRRPDLYRVMQIERNRWWARQITTLLSAEGTSFVAVGLLHVLGPDGIPHQLKSMGVDLQESAELS
jgi:uncharacterized protein YbaP (TraB family)